MDNPFANMTPEMRAALVKAGLTNAGSALAGAGNQQYAQFQAANDRLSAAEQRRQASLQNAITSSSNRFINKQASQDAGDTAAARMSGSSPLQFQNERAEAARKQQMWSQIDKGALSHLGVHAGPYGGGTNFASNFGPSAEAERPYWETQNMLSRGRSASPHMGSIYGKDAEDVDSSVAMEGSNRNKEFESQWDDQAKSETTGWAQLQKLAEEDVASAKTAAEKATKTSVWQKILGVLGTVAPIAIGMLGGPSSTIGKGSGQGGGVANVGPDTSAFDWP